MGTAAPGNRSCFLSADVMVTALASGLCLAFGRRATISSAAYRPSQVVLHQQLMAFDDPPSQLSLSCLRCVLPRG